MSASRMPTRSPLLRSAHARSPATEGLPHPALSAHDRHDTVDGLLVPEEWRPPLGARRETRPLLRRHLSHRHFDRPAGAGLADGGLHHLLKLLACRSLPNGQGQRDDHVAVLDAHVRDHPQLHEVPCLEPGMLETEQGAPRRGSRVLWLSSLGHGVTPIPRSSGRSEAAGVKGAPAQSYALRTSSVGEAVGPGGRTAT